MNEWISLPPPELNETPLKNVLLARRSVRHFSPDPITQRQLSNLLFAADGRVFDEAGRGCRTAPSAGSCYPVEILVSAHRVEGIEPGLYRYRHARHALSCERERDIAKDLMHACLSQPWVRQGAAVFLLTGIHERIMPRYKDRSVQYLFLEAGHIAQNLHLQAVAEGLGSVPVGAFTEEELQPLVGLSVTSEKVLYVIPVGVPDPAYKSC